MKEHWFFLLLFISVVHSYDYNYEYHRRNELNISINLSSKVTDTFTYLAPDIFIPYFLNPDIDLCFDGYLNRDLHVTLWKSPDTRWDSSYIKKNGLTLINRDKFLKPEFTVRAGLTITFFGEETHVFGKIIVKHCIQTKYVNLNSSNVEIELESYKPSHSTIRIPFYTDKSHNITRYIDFSSILPRRALFPGDWTRHGFCINSTSSGPVKMHLSRCKSHDQFTVNLVATEHRQIERYWPQEMFLHHENRCPITEKTMAHHLWVEIEANNGMGEIIIYNCHHTWVQSEEDSAEQIKIRPLLEIEDSLDSFFSFFAMPHRRNTYFAPLKHLIDTAMLFDNEIKYKFENYPNVTVYFSACYNSSRYTLPSPPTQQINNLTSEEVQMLAEFSNVLDCPEEKQHGFYIHIGARKTDVSGGIRFWTEKRRGAPTPTGVLKNDKYTTVAFTLKKGDTISRNVDLDELLDLAEDSEPTTLEIYANLTGKIELSVSRCKYSPRMKLFDAKEIGSFPMNMSVVQYINSLYDQNDCLTDFQDERHEYGKVNKHGLYLHVKALDDSRGYIAPNLNIRAHRNWYQLNEEHRTDKSLFRISAKTRCFPDFPNYARISIGHILSYAKKPKDYSLRFYIQAEKSVEFSFSKCNKELIIEWKNVTMLSDDSFKAWYTFDQEGVDYIDAFARSPDCASKEIPQIFVNLKVQTTFHVHMEFAIVDGVDLNLINQSTTSERTIPEAASKNNRIFTFLVDFLIIAVIVIGIAAGIFLYSQTPLYCKRAINLNNNEGYRMSAMNALIE